MPIGPEPSENERLEPAGELIVPLETGTPEVRIGAGGLLSLTAQVVGLGASFLVGVLVARMLGVEGKGMLAVLMQVPAVLIVVLDLGITTANVYFVSREEVRPGTAVANSALIASVFGVLGAPLVYALLVGPLALAPGLPSFAVGCAMLALPAGLFVSWLNGVSAGVGDLRLPLRFSLTSSVVTLLALGGLLAVGAVGINGVIGASVLGTLAGAVILLWGLRRWLMPFCADADAARRAATFSLKAYAGNLAGFLLERQDMLLLGWLSGVGQVGIYSVGVSFAELVWYVPNALSTVIAAKGGRTSEESGVDYVTRTTRIAVVVMVVTVVCGSVLVPLVVPLIYGSPFASAVLVFFALLPGVVFDGIARILWSYQTVRGRQYWRQALVATASNVVAVIVLAPRLGAVGAALASTLCYIGLAIFAIGRFSRDTGAPLRQVLVPQRSDIQVVLTTARELLLRLGRR